MKHMISPVLTNLSTQLEGGIKVNLPYKLHSMCSTPDSELVVGAGEGGLLTFSHDDVTRPIFKFNIEG